MAKPKVARLTRHSSRPLASLAAAEFCRYAARQAGLLRRTAYNHRKDDPDFRAAWGDALQEGMDMVEYEAWCRVVEGIKDPVYYQGDIVGYTRRYSDPLLGRLLQAYRPEKFAERHKHQHATDDPRHPGPPGH